MKRFAISAMLGGMMLVFTACAIQLPNGTKIGIAPVQVSAVTVVSEPVVVAPVAPSYYCCGYDYYYFGRLHRHYHRRHIHHHDHHNRHRHQ